MAHNWQITHLEYELAVAKAMVDELEQYLKSNLLYWQLSPAAHIQPTPPMLTIGGYLFRAHRLKEAADILPSVRRNDLLQVEQRFASITAEWRTATESRVDREISARINSWQWFVEDCQQRKRSCVTYYATEAELRTILELLQDSFQAVKGMDVHGERLANLDRQFKQCFQAGDFVWHSSLEAFYPVGRFWWLYGRPDLTVQ